MSLPVAYINGDKKNEENLHLDPFDNLFRIMPYDFSTNINAYNWTYYMKIWCGYSPTQISEDDILVLSQSEEVKAMPSYPDDGSIRIIDEIIVVKFAE